MNRLIAAGVAAAVCTSVVQAQTPPVAGVAVAPAPVFSLREALTAGGVASPSVEAAGSAVEAAAAARTIAGLRPNPSVQVQAENLAGSGIYKGTRSAETTASVGVPLELGGKRSARVALANARLSRAEILAAIASADLQLRITQLYVQAAAAERRAEVLAEQAAIANSGHQAASARVRAGAASPIEEQRANVLRINAEVAAESAMRDAEAARTNLATLISSPINGRLDRGWFDAVPAIYGPRAVIDAEATLTLAAADADVRTADAQLRVARTLRVPDLTVSAGARRFEASRDMAAIVGVGITIPFFNNGTALVRQSRAEQSQATALRRLAILDTQQAIASAQAEVANAAAAARAAGGSALAAAEEAARIARIGYRQGKFGQIDLLDAERTLSQTRQTYVDALAAFHDANARLDRLATPAPTSGGLQ